jgi:hypothetical protein
LVRMMRTLFARQTLPRGEAISSRLSRFAISACSVTGVRSPLSERYP